MKTTIIILLTIICLSCASTQQFGKIKYDQYGQCMDYDSIRTVQPFGVISWIYNREKDVFYKPKPFPIIVGALFLPTYVIPAALWGWFIWEPAFVRDGKWERIKKVTP